MAKKSSSKTNQQKATSRKTIPSKKKAEVKGSGSIAAVKFENILLLIILIAISILIIVGPFKRGLFFQQELLPVHIVSFGLFVLWWVCKLVRKDGSFLNSPLDWSIFALVIFYFLAFSFTAVNKRAALEEVLKVSNYFIIYLLVLDICKKKDLFLFWRKDEQAADSINPGLVILLHALAISGLAVALGGLGAATGTWDIHDAYVGGRIHSPLQYPNTAAAYLTASFFLTLGLSTLIKKNWYIRPVYLACSTVIFITIIFTYSRGAWVLLPFLSILFIAVIGRGERLRMALYIFLAASVTLLFVQRLDAAFKAGEPGVAWPYIIFAFVVILLGGLLTELFLRINIKLKLVFAGAALLLIIIFGFLALRPRLTGPLYLEHSLAQKPSHEYIEQRVSNIKGGEPYLLSLEVNASQEELLPEDESPDYAWRLLVLGYDMEDKNSTVLDYREGATSGWERKEFELMPEEEVQRLEVRIYNYFPGTAVSFRNAELKDSTSLRRLSFALGRLLPTGVYSRLFAIGSGQRSVDLRFTYYKDAFKIIKDYPLFGAGGGAWKSLYFGYQESRYFTTEVHNHFLQVWIESGFLGFLAFLSIWVFLILAFIRDHVNPSITLKHKKAWITAFIPAITLGAHSALDFNLSLATVSIFLFALLAAGGSLDAGKDYFSTTLLKKINLPGKPWSSSLLGLLLSLILFFFSFSLWQGYKAGITAEKKAAENDFKQAIELFESAVKKDPYNAMNHANLARIYEQLAILKENEAVAPKLYEQASLSFKKALSLEPYNISYNLDMARILLARGQIREGLSYINRAIELKPYDTGVFIQAARAHLAVAEHYLSIGERESAGEILHNVLLLEGRMAEYHDNAAAIAFYLGQAAFLLDDYEKAEQCFTQVATSDENYLRSQVYLAVLYEKAEEHMLAEEMKKPFVEDAEMMALYKKLLGL